MGPCRSPRSHGASSPLNAFMLFESLESALLSDCLELMLFYLFDLLCLKIIFSQTPCAGLDRRLLRMLSTGKTGWCLWAPLALLALVPLVPSRAQAQGKCPNPLAFFFINTFSLCSTTQPPHSFLPCLTINSSSTLPPPLPLFDVQTQSNQIKWRQ